MHEWVELGFQLRELNPDKYRVMLVMLQELVEAEAALAQVDLSALLELFRQPISA